MIFAALLLAATPMQLPADTQVKTVVDGITYRVRVKGRTARVYRKTTVVRPDPEMRQTMRRAVTQATGCTLIEDYFQSAYLTGLLDCSAPPQARPRP